MLSVNPLDTQYVVAIYPKHNGAMRIIIGDACQTYTYKKRYPAHSAKVSLLNCRNIFGAYKALYNHLAIRGKAANSDKHTHERTDCSE